MIKIYELVILFPTISTHFSFFRLGLLSPLDIRGFPSKIFILIAILCIYWPPGGREEFLGLADNFKRGETVKVWIRVMSYVRAE